MAIAQHARSKPFETDADEVDKCAQSNIAPFLTKLSQRVKAEDMVCLNILKSAYVLIVLSESGHTLRFALP